MKREFLTGLGIDAGVIDQIMTENGKDVEGIKAQLNVQKGLVTDLTTQVNTANTKIADFEKVDVEALTTERDSYKTQYEQALKDKDSAVAQVKYDSALDSALGKFKFTSSFAKDGVRSMLVEKKLNLKDGNFEGFDDAIKSIKESNKDAFLDTENNIQKPQFSSSVRGASSSMSEKEYLNAEYKDNPYYKG